MDKTALNWLAIILACAAGLYLLWPSGAATDAERKALEEGRVIITYWDRHSGHEYEMRRDLIEEFNRSQDRIYVRTLPIGPRAEKLLTAIASGAPPDICSIETSWLVSLAPQGCFMDLSEWMADKPYLQEEVFFPHVWDMVENSGKVYAIPSTTDSFCLLWNKAAFRRAGLDPERPPQTMQELQEYAAKLMVPNKTGGYDQIGFLPWLPFDVTYMWGGLFGGEWYDPATQYANCADDPRIIEMFQWIQDFAIPPSGKPKHPYSIDADRFQSYTKMGGAYASASNPFYSGKVAMITEGEWQVTFIKKYAPDLDWGVAPIPQPEGAPPRVYSPSAVTDAIPTGSRHVAEALAFLDWFYAPRPGGGTSPVSDYCKAIHNIPCRREEALQDRFMGDPKFRVFIEEVLNKPAMLYPEMVASQFMQYKIEELRESVMFYRKTPEEAARAAEHETNAELRSKLRILQRVEQ